MAESAVLYSTAQYIISQSTTRHGMYLLTQGPSPNKYKYSDILELVITR